MRTPVAERHSAPLKAAEKIRRRGRPVPVDSRERTETGGRGWPGEMWAFPHQRGGRQDTVAVNPTDRCHWLVPHEYEANGGAVFEKPEA